MEKVAFGIQKLSQQRGKIGPRLLLRTYSKSHTRFLLVPSTTLDDLQRSLCTLFQKYMHHGVVSAVDVQPRDDRPVLLRPWPFGTWSKNNNRRVIRSVGIHAASGSFLATSARVCFCSFLLTYVMVICIRISWLLVKCLVLVKYFQFHNVSSSWPTPKRRPKPFVMGVCHKIANSAIPLSCRHGHSNVTRRKSRWLL